MSLYGQARGTRRSTPLVFVIQSSYLLRYAPPMTANSHTRRSFLSRGAAGFAAFAAGGLRATDAQAAQQSYANAPFAQLRDIGPLGDADANGVRLPAGFQSRIVARSGEKPCSQARSVWHDAPDGGAAFAGEAGGWIYVSNSEVRGGKGGVSALRFDARGDVVDSYRILENTSSNCAGGATPWGTWLSCEEHDSGLVYECDPQRPSNGVARPLRGSFSHEAAAVDLAADRLYLTEDERDGGFYRFTADRGLPDLSSGLLEIATVVSRAGAEFVEWRAVPDPLARNEATRHQLADAYAFKGGEGIALHAGVVYFTTKRDNRVWAYRLDTQELRVLYDAQTTQDPVLSGVDNLTVTPAGDVLVAEDGGDMQLVVLTPSADGESAQAVPLLQLVGHDDSEITGPAFDPSFTRLYFSSQRGAQGSNGAGVTYEITRV